MEMQQNQTTWQSLRDFTFFENVEFLQIPQVALPEELHQQQGVKDIG